jgi:hypothetical protein
VVTDEADRIQSGAAASKHDAEIRQALDVWKRAVLSGDPDRLTDCYASTVEQYFNKRNATRRDVRRTISDFLAGRGRVRVLRISDVAITSVYDGRAAATFRKHWETTGRRPFSGEERERLTFVNTDDGWKIAREEELRVYWTKRR